MLGAAGALGAADAAAALDGARGGAGTKTLGADGTGETLGAAVGGSVGAAAADIACGGRSSPDDDRYARSNTSTTTPPSTTASATRTSLRTAAGSDGRPRIGTVTSGDRSRSAGSATTSRSSAASRSAFARLPARASARPSRNPTTPRFFSIRTFRRSAVSGLSGSPGSVRYRATGPASGELEPSTSIVVTSFPKAAPGVVSRGSAGASGTVVASSVRGPIPGSVVLDSLLIVPSSFRRRATRGRFGVRKARLRRLRARVQARAWARRYAWRRQRWLLQTRR